MKFSGKKIITEQWHFPYICQLYVCLQCWRQYFASPTGIPSAASVVAADSEMTVLSAGWTAVSIGLWAHFSFIPLPQAAQGPLSSLKILDHNRRKFFFSFFWVKLESLFLDNKFLTIRILLHICFAVLVKVSNISLCNWHLCNTI